MLAAIALPAAIALRNRASSSSSSTPPAVSDADPPAHSSDDTRIHDDDQRACADVDALLDTVDAYLDGQPRQRYMRHGAGLLQTFGPHSFGGGDCGAHSCELVEPCPNYQQAPHCRYDVYDNALAAIYLTKRGKLDDARRILDSFVQLLYKADGTMTLLAAGYTDAPAAAGEYQGPGVADGAVDTGNNAWVGLALAHYSAEAHDACYGNIARELLDALKAESCDDHLGGFASRLPPYPHFYRSAEHNTDVYALARMLGASDVAERARRFVVGMFGQTTKAPQTYATGTSDAHKCDATTPQAATAADVQFWSLLSGVDPDPARKLASVRWALESPAPGAAGDDNLRGLWWNDTDRIGNPHAGDAGKGAVLHGVRFTSWGNGIQWENTASAVMALRLYAADYAADEPIVGLVERMYAARDSLCSLIQSYRCIPASVLGGNINAYIVNNHSAPFPGGSDTGIGWTYLRYPHLAGTMWAGLMLIDAHPSKVRLDANPYSPPAKAVPPYDKGAMGCRPQNDLPSGGSGRPSPSAAPAASPSPGGGARGGGTAACASHAACKGLEGDCCPTADGTMLGCCS